MNFWATPLFVVQGTIGGPQLAVNTSNNYVYFVCADYAGNAVWVATSTNHGLTFQNWHGKLARNSLVGPLPQPCPGNPPDCTPLLRARPASDPKGPGHPIRAYTLPIARYNAAANVLGVVWHEREPGNTGNPVITDTSYAYYNDTQWQPAVPLMLNGYYPGHDNFQPALDSDIHGNVWFVWYDTNYAASDKPYIYQRAWSYTTYTGGYVGGTFVGGFKSDPSYNLYASIGDYQDIVSVPNGPYYGRFVHAWVGVPTATLRDDIYISDYHQ
jgi:hypothetical protein